MDTDLKQEIKEITEVVKVCPESVQVRAFELLLQDYLARRSSKTHSRQHELAEEHEKKNGTAHHPKEDEKSAGIASMIVPMRLKAFLKKHSLDPSSLGKIFHVEGGEVIPIWDVEATKTSQAQMEISLYCALRQALQKGEFVFDRDDVKTLCDEKGVHPKHNFNANYKNNDKLFTGLDKTGQVSLSAEGMSRLAELIRSVSVSK